LLNVPLKESCVVFIIWEHIIVVISFDALFGLTWHMLTPCLTTNKLPLVLLGDGARKEAAGVEQYVLVRGD
jgi:hypothetical protein